VRAEGTDQSAVWRPRALYRLLGLESWELWLDYDRLVLSDRAESRAFDIRDVLQPVCHDRDSAVRISATHTSVVLMGAARATRRSFADALDRALDERRRRDAFEAEERRRLAALANAADLDGAAALAWWQEVQVLMDRLRWADQESVEALERRRPSVDNWQAAVADAQLAPAFLTRVEECTAVHDVLALDLRELAAERNEAFLAYEERAMYEFFQTVEKSPLTAEQTRAVVCFDNRVRVIAAAGSGKTSTMVARAGYAIRRDIVRPTEILALAFNAKASKELSERLGARLGDEGRSIASSTFHALGLRIIGEATGRKPSVAEDINRDKGHGRLRRAVDALRDQDAGFRRDWDLFRLVFGHQLRELGDEDEPEDVDRDTGRAGFRTLAGELVKSREEVMIANWLFVNGVRYEYERSYTEDVADATHRQYQPDFYYPDIDAWHEHWAIGPDGQPPAAFEGYAEAMEWRRQTHAAFGTDLIETTSAMIRDDSGSGFKHLEAELRRRGVVLNEDPDRAAVGEPPITDRGIISLLRTFMSHAKGNRLDPAVLVARGGKGLRTRLFLRLYAAIVDEWDRQLRAEQRIDYEDMLNLATEHVLAGRWTSPYRLFMVDEMQDMSTGRADLVRALLGVEGAYLYAVGDDWQAINRFAGSDLTVMTRFEDWFGPATTVMLARTFRSPQALCDTAGAFVSKNRAQLAKAVTSSAPPHGQAVIVTSVVDRRDYDRVLRQSLEQLDARQAPSASVLVLGRYRSAEKEVEAALRTEYSNLRVSFDTVHGSKGKEADYVVVLAMERKTFPSAMEDDPLLQLAMAAPDPYPEAEERRLFYVALTRARRSVLILTRARHESPFLLELVSDRVITIQAATGEDITPVICPTCKKHTMAKRERRDGRGVPFLGCRNWPICNGRRSIPSRK
jgi:DNA helicase-4